MTRLSGFLVLSCMLAVLLGHVSMARAQQLEPRAYSASPVGVNFIGIGYLYSSGGAVLDPSLPVQNVEARVDTVLPFYTRTFDLFGRLANIGVVLPLAQAAVSGDVMESRKSVERTGLGDAGIRFAVTLIGLPAMSPREFFRERKADTTTLGVSLTVFAPVGQYDSAKLANLGTNRWAFKPEVGLSYPRGSWDFEVYAGLWLFTANTDFLGGHVRRQDPLESFQAHVVYEIRPRLWAAADVTYYEGGSTTVDGQNKNDRQANTRAGVTLAVPLTVGQSLKLSWSRGVSTRIGSSFDTLGVAWQYLWF